MKKIIFFILGLIGLGLGVAGAILPMMPTIPFLMLSAFCFLRSSDRLTAWFKNTKLYKNNMEYYVRGKGMTAKTKIMIICIVTLAMVPSVIAMWRKGVVIGSVVLACVWLAHVICFIFVVKNYKGENSDSSENEIQK